MAQHWIFQANPKRYDIDAALQSISDIAWRVPQFTGEIQPGDIAVIWRAGREAGVVGVGRVVSTPAVQTIGEEEQPYAAPDEDAIGETTRVVVRIRPCDWVPKEQVAALGSMGDHPIITAPMGSIFRLSPEQWEALAGLLPEPPSSPSDISNQTLPKPFAWGDRRKSIFSLPGSYEALVDTLGRILGHVESHRPGRDDAASWMKEEFDVPELRAVRILGFLQSVSLIRSEAGRLEPTPQAAHWLEDPDNLFLLALLHSRAQFVGEMLAALQEPRTSQQLLDYANDQYDARWTTRAQIDRRRGWLQSTGAIAIDGQGRLQITEQGRSILAQLQLSPPVSRGHAMPEPSVQEASASSESTAQPRSQTETANIPPAPSNAQRADRLAKRLLETAHDANDPDAFEQTIAACFDFLGFHSEWLGGAGKTDVLLKANLDSRDRYVVIVDAKTTSRDAVRDGQIDWVTLQEHRNKYQADHAAIVGPAFQGDRLAERAKSYGVSVIEAADLAALCRQHARVPLGLDAYRDLFRLGDISGTDAVAEHGEEFERWLVLAERVYHLIEQLEGDEGALSARDLYWNLRGSPGGESDGFSDDDIAAVLETLSSQPIGILRRRDGGFSSIGSSRTAAQRLRRLADLIQGIRDEPNSTDAPPTNPPDEPAASSGEYDPDVGPTVAMPEPLELEMPHKKRIVFDAGIKPEGGSLSEVAKKLSCTIGNIRQHLAQIRDQYGYQYRTKGDRFWITRGPGNGSSGKGSPPDPDRSDPAKVKKYREALKRQHTDASKNVRWRPVKK
ncbi:MAG: EVE domain-containing protein [Gammaproteobacteria bacterium]|nr:EVE domain-containing protein [Gammaproteobacteria bacterium]